MLYLDSSVLLKHYVYEPGTDAINQKVNQQLKNYEGIFVSVLGYAEILATFARLVRENVLLRQDSDLLVQSFQDDWTGKLSRVDLSLEVLAFIPSLVGKHPLRGADSIHLASALWLRDAARLGKPSGTNIGVLEFATSDKQLKTAAALEGLKVFDPLNPV